MQIGKTYRERKRRLTKTLKSMDYHDNSHVRNLPQLEQKKAGFKPFQDNFLKQSYAIIPIPYTPPHPTPL